MRILFKSSLLVFTLAMPPIFCAAGFRTVIDVGSISSPSKLDPQRCNWYCHNRSCPHPSRLPAALTSDDGAFGMTIEALAAAGKETGLGYKGMNILVFCILWPLITYAFYVVAAFRAIWNLV